MATASNFIFTFEELGSAKDKALKQVVKQFTKAGAVVAGSPEVGTSTKRTAGISYREVFVTFVDSQQVTLRVKQSGDIYQVLLNGKVIPIKNQDDHAAAVAEIVGAMNAGRAKFEKALVAAKVKLPAGIRTAAPKMEQVLTEKRDALKDAIQAVRDEIASLTPAAA